MAAESRQARVGMSDHSYNASPGASIVAIERLRAERTKGGSVRYAKHRSFDVRKLIALPAASSDGEGAPPEIDLEGISFADDYLWIAGSHSAARREPEVPREISGCRFDAQRTA